MGRPKNLPAAALGILLTATAVGYYLTREPRDTVSEPAAATTASPHMQVLNTARRLAATAETTEERGFAAEALRLADHDVDQGFATALRRAAASAATLSAPLRPLAAQVKELRDKVAAERQRIAEMEKSDPDSDPLAFLKAQLALDEDELEDKQGELARKGGDPHAAIQRALQEHEAAQKVAVEPARGVAAVPDTLAGHVRAWFALAELRNAVAQAQREAAAKQDSLQKRHDKLEAESPASGGDGKQRLQTVMEQMQTKRELDARIGDTRDLAAVYGRWSDELGVRRRAEVHGLLRILTWMIAVLLAAMLAAAAIRRGMKLHTDRRRAHQLRFMATLAVQLVAAGIVLLIAFGKPTQLSTIIGLATAGLTVVLKDFIVAFFGWFVLMGRHGLRIGDWVEILGVSGEVIEIGLLRTVILEMGNWGDTGHPTGRRVGFNNSFAIEGHYFNFSTAGQWLWDEVRVTVPQGSDPYRVAEEIRSIVERATDADAEEATQDWERATRQYGTKPFSARPAVDLKPGPMGLEIAVRYIARAHQKNDRKSKMLQEIVGLLHRGQTSPAPIQSEPRR
jgi:hypothetical protein